MIFSRSGESDCAETTVRNEGGMPFKDGKKSSIYRSLPANCRVACMNERRHRSSKRTNGRRMSLTRLGNVRPLEAMESDIARISAMNELFDDVDRAGSGNGHVSVCRSGGGCGGSVG